MGRSGTLACVLVGWLAAGCQITPLAAETGAFACNNTRDEDGDNMRDCEDPDCWGYAHCRVQEDASAPFVPAVPPAEIPDGLGGPPLKPPANEQDSGMPVHIPDLGDASIDVDAAPDAELPPVCDPSCPEHRCVAGVCAAPVDLGAFLITSLEISVPRAIDGQCLDPDQACGFKLSPCCTPDPDLYVSVAGVKVAFADIDDAAYFLWQRLDVVVELREDDVVRFEVLDDDTADGDVADGEPDPVFECSTTVTVDNVATGMLRCSPGIEGLELGVPYRVTARIAPASPAEAMP
jgi:hypothetical protein